MLITGALIVGTAALVVATGGIGAACVPGLIAATAGGALLGAGGDVVGQMISNGSMDLSKIDWGSVALSGLAGGATGLLSATGAGPVAMGIMGGVSSGVSEIYHQMQSGEDINWGQVAVRTLGGAVSGAVLGNVGSQTASGAKEIAKNAGKVFLANGGVSFAENLTYNLIGGEDLGTAAKQASFSALISGGTSAGFYALGQAAKNMCFVEGTMVLTAAGLVAIESIAVGDMVIATDPETGETAEKQVKNTFVNETEELAHVFVDGEEIVCTPGHKFYAPEKGWTSAIKLRAGDQLQLVNGEYVTVEKVQHELLEEPVKVYNFEVEDFHTYYVGTDVQVLVHNMRCSAIENDKSFGNYEFKEGIDIDLRGGKGTFQDALDLAFQKAGLSKENFTVTKWGKNKYGKSFPVEWKASNGAEVSVDLGHSLESGAPTVPHVGWQTGGKRGNGGAVRGHIFVDDVPYNR